MSKYLKLGEGRHTFHSMSTGFNLVNKQVKKVIDNADKSHKEISEGLKTGHIVWASEAEYNEYQKLHASPTGETSAAAPKPEKPSKSKTPKKPEPDLEPEEDDEDEDEDDELTKSEMIDALKVSDKVAADQKSKLTKLPDEELKKLYNQVFSK